MPASPNKTASPRAAVAGEAATAAKAERPNFRILNEQAMLRSIKEIDEYSIGAAAGSLRQVLVDIRGKSPGDVYDVVMNPQTGKIPHLGDGRGGVFGIGENHVPVPWEV